MYTKWFDYDKIKDSLAIRNRRKGDYFVLDAAGHHKKLEDYFVNEKIPASHRDEQLLLAGRMKSSGLSEGVWHMAQGFPMQPDGCWRSLPVIAAIEGG